MNHQEADTTTGAVERNDNPTDSWPLEARHALALVARVTREVDDACDERRNLLLDDLDVCRVADRRGAGSVSG